MAILTNIGVSKYNAAVAAGTKILIKRVAFGSNTGAVSASTTNIGTALITSQRVHLHLGFSKGLMALATPVILRDQARTYQVGYYDADNALLIVDQITLPAKSSTDIWRIVRSQLAVANFDVFDSLPSSPKAIASVRSVHQALHDCRANISKMVPPSPVGMVLKYTGYSPSPDFALSQANVVQSTAELDLAKNSIPSMAEMFANWERFSHSGSTYPGNAAELNGWALTADQRVTTTINSASYIGFLSPTQHRNYELDVQITSTSGDDDLGGVVIASIKQAGVHHTLSALRCLGGWSTGWKLIYNFGQSGPGPAAKIILNKADSVIWGDGITHTSPTSSSANVSPPYVQNGGWSRANIAAGTRIVITRNGDLITAQCSDFGSTALKAETLMTLNLADYPELSVFRQACNYGYSNQSQPNMFWKTNKFVDKDNLIYDFRNGDIYQHNGTDWAVVNGASIQLLGLNKFIYSPVNKKTFYISGTGSLSEVA